MPSDATDRSHPVLFGLGVAGAVGMALGAVVGLLGVDWWPLRLGVLGAMLLIFGLAGYVAIGVFERQPGS